MNILVYRRLCPALVAATLLGGCAASRPNHDPETAIAEATGLSSGLVFRTEGGPVDEPEPTVGSLALRDALLRAVTSDAGLQAALARVRIALSDADQARLLPNPVLSLILKFPEGGGRPNIEAELSADIVSILLIRTRANAADNRLNAACADAVTVALDVVTEVQERYASVQALEELMPVLEERERLSDKLVQVARDRLEAGEGTRSDVTTLEAQHVELEVEIADAEREHRDERLRLSRLIGQPSGAAEWKVERRPETGAARAPESAWIEAALAHRPELQSITWELAALGDDLSQTRLALLAGATAGAKADRDDGWAAGPSISTPLPVFDFGQARRNKAGARRIEARHKLTQVRRQVVEEVRRAYQSLTATQANLDRVRRELIPLQRQRRSQAEDAYRAGLADATVLFLAEQDLQAALARRVRLEQAAVVSQVRLERAAGGAGIASKLASGSVPEAQPTTPLGAQP